MNSMNRNDDEVDVAARIVCLIDMVGTKEMFKEWPTLEEVGNPSCKARDVVKKMVDGLQKFGDAFVEFLDEKMTQGELHDIGLDTEEKLATYEPCPSDYVTVSRFSDTFLFYTGIVQSNRDRSVVALFKCLRACCWGLLSSLKEGMPLRGGIVLGVGATSLGGGLYGPALAEAHRLETDEAGLARIIVADKVVDFLDAREDDIAHEAVSSAMNLLAGHCRSLLWRDVDGQWIVDFLGKGVYTRLKDEQSRRQWRELGTPGYAFVCREAKRFQEEGPPKLALRYHLLKSYMDARLPIWGMSPEA